MKYPFRVKLLLNGLRGGVAAVVLPPVVLSTPAYSDDFETVGPLSARPNWVFNVPAQATNWATVGGYVHFNTYSPTNDVLFGPSVGDFIFTAGYDTSGTGGTAPTAAWNENYQSFDIWWQDVNNYMTASIITSTQRLTFSGKVGGTNITGNNWFNGVPWLPTGSLTIVMKGGLLRAMVDGKWLTDANRLNYPKDVIDVSAQVTGANRAGKVGIKASNGTTYALAQYITVDPLQVSIDAIDPFVGRDSLSATGGTNLVSGTYSGSPVSWVYRVLNSSTMAVVQDWRALGSPTASAGVWSGSVFLPTGGGYFVQAGWVGADGITRAALSRLTVSGIRVLTWGQSNSSGRNTGVGNAGDTTVAALNAYLPLLTNQAGSIGTITGSPANQWRFKDSPLYVPQCAYETARAASALLGKPVGINALGVAGTSMENLSPSYAPNWAIFTSGIAETRGIVEAVIWDQGEADADVSAGVADTAGGTHVTTYASWFLANMLPALRTATGNPTLIVLLAQVGRYANTNPPLGSGANAALNDDHRNTIRGQLDVIAASDPYVKVSSHKLGVAHMSVANGGAYHYIADMTGYGEMSRRDGLSLAKMMGAAHDGLGPIPTGATRSGATITIALNLNGATGLTGPTTFSTGAAATPSLAGAVNGYGVSADNFATLLSISSVALSGNTVVITLASAPAGAVKVRSFYGCTYDDSVLFYGAYSDTANIPIMPITTPLVTN